MFGHKDDNDKNDQQAAPVENASPAEEHSDVVVGNEDNQAPTAPVEEWQHPGAPIQDDAVSPPIDTPVPPAPEPPSPVDGVTPPPGYQPPAPSDTPASAPATGSDDLVGVRQQALSDLSPLIGHLEHQTPEEKFQVTMMMIQANDDRSLIPTAYETAKQISDEKARAQALLDIVQEINYFTQPSQS